MSRGFESLDSINTMTDLAQGLKRRRIKAGFANLPDLLKNAKRDHRLPRSTAYNLEAGAGRSNWVAVEAHLRACGADDQEIEAWREAHGRAVWNYGNQDTTDSARASVPTAKQLAEMGSEQAGRVLSEIDPVAAADLLRRIKVKQAVDLLPEINPRIAIELLAATSRPRAILLFENIDRDKGAELLAEMVTADALGLLDELDTPRAAELIAAMPRGMAAKLLRSLTHDRAIQLLMKMPARQAAKLLGELHFDVAIGLTRTSQARRAAEVLEYMDREVAAQLLTEYVTDERAVELLTKISPGAAAGCLNQMNVTQRWTLIAPMTTDHIGEMFEFFYFAWKVELLSHRLSAREAAMVVVHTSVDEAQHVLESVRPECLAKIIAAMDPHERVLMLASMPAIRTSALAKLSTDDADRLQAEMTLPRLAEHLASIDPERGVLYLRTLNDDGGVEDLLSHMNFDDAARLIGRVSGLAEKAAFLKAVAPAQIARFLIAMETWAAAAVLEDLPADSGALALTEIDPVTAERILRQVDDRIDLRLYNQTDLSTAEFDVVRAQRRAAATHLRDRVAEFRTQREASTRSVDHDQVTANR